VLSSEVESLGAVNLDRSPGVALPEDGAVGVVGEEVVLVLSWLRQVYSIPMDLQEKAGNRWKRVVFGGATSQCLGG
jgi:hypothetical protein